ncbi:lantibiotic dehydratase [Planomonospora parontospora]|uniref:lantibiotic dehydratase n=1 Tax=Planomonospora parontospora TaxID=58119 RepID=UPI003608C869
MAKVGLGGTGWSVWSDALLRTTGFPAGGLEVFAAPEAAGAADELLAGRGAVEVFDEALAGAVAAGAERIWRIAADPLFREAVTWQNPGVLVALDGIVAGGPRAVRNVRRRDRERAVVRYWQRYCAKNETIGFFGPVCWVGVGAAPGAEVGAGAGPDAGRAVQVRVGPGLLRERRVFLEGWALAAYADHLAADPRVRCWWPPMLLPQLSVRGAVAAAAVAAAVAVVGGGGAGAGPLRRAHCGGGGGGGAGSAAGRLPAAGAAGGA